MPAAMQHLMAVELLSEDIALGHSSALKYRHVYYSHVQLMQAQRRPAK